MEPLHSVIVPARNAAATLTDALDSLLAQSESRWEAIIVDDCSTDATGRIASAYAAKDKRFSVLRGPAKGASAARNVGITHARGKRLLFLDSDDWVAPDFLSSLGAALDAQPSASATYCAYQRVTPRGLLTEPRLPAEVEQLAFEALARRSALVIHSVLVDRQLIVELGGFDEGLRTCEEWDLWQRAARAGARFVAVCEPLAFYRMSSNSLTSNALTMVRDAADVIGRGFSADLRARKPAQAHANGADPTYGTADVALALFTLWCAGYQLGRGADIATVLTAGRLVDLNNDLGYAAEVILDSLTVGAGCTLSELAGRWDVLEESLPALLGRLEAASSQPGLRRRLQYELERRVLNSAQLPDPLSLTLTAAVPFDVRRPSSFVPRQGVDRLLVRLHRGNKELGTIEMPVFGAASAYEIAQEAIDHLGVRTFVRESGADRRPRAWLTGTAIVTRGLFAKRPRRANLRPLARRAVRTAALAHLHAPTNDQWSSFCPPNAAHGEHDRRDARSTPTSSEQRFARASSGGSQAFDRRAYWDSVFAQADPWNYDSDYERVKRERTLSLVPPRIKRACELACAEGHFTERLAKTVDHLTAADISAAALSRARARCAALANVDFAQLDLVTDALPERVDLLVCSEVLYYLSDEDELAAVCRRLRDALSEGGWLLSAHPFVLRDDLGRTGFDWDHRYGAATIAEVLAATPGLFLETSLQTDLYRIDLFRRETRGETLSAPRIQRLPIGCKLDADVARQVVWGGAEIRRSEALERERTDCLPILMYHRVAEDGPPELARYRTPAAAFEAQMRWLRSHGYYAISATQLAERMHDRAELPGRPVLISFDDATTDFHDTAWPILRECDFSADVFVVTDMIGGHAVWDSDHGPPAPLMSEDQVARLACAGIRFGSHLATHRRADALSSAELLSELTRSRSRLETLTGAKVTSFAAPHGVIDQRLVFLAKRCGYQIGLTSHHGFASLESDPLRLPRIEVRGDWSLEQFAEAVRGRPNPCNDLVSVVIPACNAGETIDETLRSVRAQTHENIEIIVVDDGSEDKTAEIVRSHAAVDCRISMVRQPNSGVAEARNRGARSARGQLLAFIDADDLWSPDNIRKQLAALWAGGAQAGLVYSWYAAIDGSGRIIDSSYQPTESGDVLKRICGGNLVGNGSAALVTRAAFEAVGGFDPTLRALGAQGCEDWQFYFKVAERYRFALVREFLTGYRLRPGAMSNDLVRMLRSSTHLANWMRRRQPQLRGTIASGSTFYARWLLATAVRQRRYVEAAKLALALLRRSPPRAARLTITALRAAIRPSSSVPPRQERNATLRFTIGAPRA